MNFQLQPHLTAAKRKLPFECVTLLLQGGGALGAYQGGVYEALAEADIHPELDRRHLDRGDQRRHHRRQPAQFPHRPIARVLDAGDFERAVGLVRQSIR